MKVNASGKIVDLKNRAVVFVKDNKKELISGAILGLGLGTLYRHGFKSGVYAGASGFFKTISAKYPEIDMDGDYAVIFNPGKKYAYFIPEETK